MLRQLIREREGKTAHREIMEDYERLHEIFYKTMKRKLPSDMIVISAYGGKTPIYGLVAYYKPEQRADVEFLINNK